ncbi:MAG: hypothetical protein IPM96_02350 [Ignavibacteria bacterium]|nr:hypothetical protein [Ignavibacteria bacterium]
MVFTYKETPANYDNWLQTNFDENTHVDFNFTEVLKLMNTLSKDKEIDFYSLHQSYSWYDTLLKLKEPTNEEMEMIANVSLTYGERGLIDTKKMFALKQIE